MFNLDLLLTLAGMFMAAIGVAVLLVGKPRHGAPGEARRNVFEAFGIKLDVANPSVLLIMFGVVLMLTPRFLPLKEGPLEAGEPVDLPGAIAEVLSPAPATESTAPGVAVAQSPGEAPPADDVKPPTPEPVPRVVAAAPPSPPEPKPAAPKAVTPKPVTPKPIVPDAITPEPAVAAVTPPKSPEPAAPAPSRLLILTEALSYDGESAASLRGKLHGELRTAVRDVLGDEVAVEAGNPGFRDTVGAGDLLTLCKRTRAEHLLLADLTAVEVESFSVESANWPNMRYSAVACGSGRVWRSDEMRMEPTVGDRYPLQQSVARSVRDFIRKQRHLLR